VYDTEQWQNSILDGLYAPLLNKSFQV